MASGTRGSESTADAVRTTVVFLGLIGLVVAFFALNRPEPALPDAVDYESVVDVVSETYPYEVLAPAAIPDGWRATSVDHAQDAGGNRWRVGFLVDGDDFIGIEQTDGEIQSYLREQLAGFDEDGAGRIGAARWQRWVENDRDPDRALVLIEDGVITIVRGTTSYAMLEEVVTWLE